MADGVRMFIVNLKSNVSRYELDNVLQVFPSISEAWTLILMEKAMETIIDDEKNSCMQNEEGQTVVGLQVCKALNMLIGPFF